MAQDLKISVIIPLYNKEKSIANTVSSVLSQTHGNFECLIVDDGSTDNSLQVLSTINDERLKIFKKQNGGVSEARNYGIRQATTDNIFFLDADDTIAPECLQTFVRLIEKYPGAGLYTTNFSIKSGSEILKFCKRNNEGVVIDPVKALFYREIFPRTGSLLIKRSCFDMTEPFRADLKIHEDIELFLRLMNLFEVVYSPAVIFVYETAYNELSKKLASPAVEYAYHIKLGKHSFFEQMVLSEIIGKMFKRRIRHNDLKNAGALFLRNKRFPFIYMLSVFFRKLH